MAAQPGQKVSGNKEPFLVQFITSRKPSRILVHELLKPLLHILRADACVPLQGCRYPLFLPLHNIGVNIRGFNRPHLFKRSPGGNTTLHPRTACVFLRLTTRNIARRIETGQRRPAPYVYPIPLLTVPTHYIGFAAGYLETAAAAFTSCPQERRRGAHMKQVFFELPLLFGAPTEMTQIQIAGAASRSILQHGGQQPEVRTAVPDSMVRIIFVQIRLASRIYLFCACTKRQRSRRGMDILYPQGNKAVFKTGHLSACADSKGIARTNVPRTIPDEVSAVSRVGRSVEARCAAGGYNHTSRLYHIKLPVPHTQAKSARNSAVRNYQVSGCHTVKHIYLAPAHGLGKDGL